MLPRTDGLRGAEHHSFTLLGGKPAALLIHGFPGTADDMRPIAQLLNTEGWTADVPTLPGFGAELAELGAHGVDDWLAALAESLRALRQNHAPIMLVGHSLGGALAIVAAAREPVDALVLLAPFYRLEHPLWAALPVLQRLKPRIKPFRMYTPEFDDPVFRQMFGKFMPDADFNDPAHREAILDFVIPVRVFAQLRDAGHTAYRHAPDVNVPVLVLQGSHDTLVTRENTHRLAERLSGVVSEISVPGDHEIYRSDRPSWPRVSAEIREFAKQRAVKEAQ